MNEDELELASMLESVRTLHEQIATDLLSRWPVMECPACEFTFTPTVADVARYLRHGWPRHCDITMRLVRADGTP